jgi:hypothetical protein
MYVINERTCLGCNLNGFNMTVLLVRAGKQNKARSEHTPCAANQHLTLLNLITDSVLTTPPLFAVRGQLRINNRRLATFTAEYYVT